MYKCIILSLFITLCNGFILQKSKSSGEIFDPCNFLEKCKTNGEKNRLSEAELKHGRWSMIGCTTIPLVESHTHQPAIHQFDHLPSFFQLGIVSLILMGEMNTMLNGYENPFSLNKTDTYFKLREDYIPGDFGFKIDVKDETLYEKELNNGRLAMISFIGMISQELFTKSSLL